MPWNLVHRLVVFLLAVGGLVEKGRPGPSSSTVGAGLVVGTKVETGAR